MGEKFNNFHCTCVTAAAVVAHSAHARFTQKGQQQRWMRASTAASFLGEPAQPARDDREDDAWVLPPSCSSSLPRPPKPLLVSPFQLLPRGARLDYRGRTSSSSTTSTKCLPCCPCETPSPPPVFHTFLPFSFLQFLAAFLPRIGPGVVCLFISARTTCAGVAPEFNIGKKVGFLVLYDPWRRLGCQRRLITRLLASRRKPLPHLTTPLMSPVAARTPRPPLSMLFTPFLSLLPPLLAEEVRTVATRLLRVRFCVMRCRGHGARRTRLGCSSRRWSSASGWRSSGCHRLLRRRVGRRRRGLRSRWSRTRSWRRLSDRRPTSEGTLTRSTFISSSRALPHPGVDRRSLV